MASLRGVGLTVKYKTRIRHGTAKTTRFLPCAHAAEAARQCGCAMLVFVGQEKKFPRGRRTAMRYQLYYWPEIQGAEANSSGWHLRRVRPITWTSPVCQSEAWPR